MQALTPHAYAQVARARSASPDRHTTRRREEREDMPYSKDLQWLSGEAAYQNSYTHFDTTRGTGKGIP